MDVAAVSAPIRLTGLKPVVKLGRSFHQDSHIADILVDESIAIDPGDELGDGYDLE